MNNSVFRELPKIPFRIRGRSGYIVVIGQPKRIVIKLAFEKILIIVIICVNNRLFPVSFFYNPAPYLKVFNKFVIGFSLRDLFNIQDRRKVAAFQFYIFKKIGLFVLQPGYVNNSATLNRQTLGHHFFKVSDRKKTPTNDDV